MSPSPDRSHPWFSSRRERRLWAAVLVVLLAIALTLVLGQSLAEALGAREVLDGAFAIGLPFVGAAVVALALGPRPRGRDLGIGLALVAIALLIVSRAGLTAAERTHLVEYAILAALIHAALEERATHGRGPAHPALAALVIATLIGVVDESLQAVMPGRIFDPIDLVFNTTAVLTAVALGVAVRWLKRRTATVAPPSAAEPPGDG